MLIRHPNEHTDLRGLLQELRPEERYTMAMSLFEMIISGRHPLL